MEMIYKNLARLAVVWAIPLFLFLSSEANGQESLWKTYNEAGLQAYKQSRLAEAEKFFSSAVKAATAVEYGGTRHAVSLLNLATIYETQGRYNDAERAYTESIRMLEKKVKEDDPLVARAFNNLGELYRKQGRYIEAEPLLQGALEKKTKALGPDHPDVVPTLSNLAALFASQGRYTQAEPLYQRALAIRERALGPEHRDVAQSLNGLASLYYTQGRYAEAEL